MDWTEIFRVSLNIMIWIFLFAMFCSVLDAFLTSDYKTRLIDWLQGRVNDLEWENKELRSQLQWVQGDLAWAKRRADLAEETKYSILVGYDKMLAEMADKKGGGNSGAPMQAVA